MRSVEPRRLRNWVVVVAIVAAITAIVVAYPYFLGISTQRYGVRIVAFVALLAIVVSYLWSRRFGALAPKLAGIARSGAAPSFGIPFLLLAAASTGDSMWMQLVPSLVYLTVADLFRASLRDGSSMVEMGAKYLVPQLPDFVRAYCRKVTVFWALFFAVSAGLIASFAVARAEAWWSLYTGQLIYLLMLAISAVEFLIRKTWFRYYPHMGPIDRFWSHFFPAENTEVGRRSEAYIRLHKPESGGRP